MKKKTIYIASAIVILAAGFLSLRSFKSTNETFAFETARIQKGTISNTVTATGKLEAITTVELGTQVSGVIDKIFVDFNSQVKKGQLLARIDETPLLAQLEQSKANVDQADAEVKYQQANFDRYKVLEEKKLIAQSDYDLVVYNLNKAIANRNNAKSVYDKNKINLSYASIYSPIDGIILDRKVDEGQTVAASFNTPTLFTIANDLTQMRVEANVDEADIGQVKINQRVEFTVDAYPEMKFTGAVTEIRMQPVTTSNVVTYTVIIQAPNPDKKLMPGMTASTTIYVNEKSDVLIVPGKALRFSPDEQTFASYLKTLPEDTAKKMSIKPVKAGPADKNTFIWTKKGNVIQPVEVKTGENDGINYELLSGLKQGDEIVLSMTSEKPAAAAKASRSPFMPTRPGQRK
ncbi:MAG: efflux RND transporter periplasmic adaptor subunit [Candidatus Saccharibacteria bacterium]